MKRTDYANLVRVSEEDLDDTEQYRVQTIKERTGAATVGYNISTSTEESYFGIVKEPLSLKFSGVEDTEYISSTFTLQSGTCFTRFKESTDLSLNPLYDGGERIYLNTSNTANIKNKATSNTDNYIFLVYVELKKNKKFDEAGINTFYVDREEGWVIAQLTAAQVSTLGTFSSNPSGYVDISNIEAPNLDSELTNDEKSYTFGTWSTPNGIFTVDSPIRITHYNSVFIGKVEVTNLSPVSYKFYHTLKVTDTHYGNWNRPGYSVVDQYHRNLVGNGIKSVTNPHGTSVTDLENFNNTIVDHRNIHHTSGISPKGSGALECVSNGTTTPDSVTITQLAGSEYLFIQGKRVTTVSPITGLFGDIPATGTYYIYVQATGSPIISYTAPFESYSGLVSKGTSVPSNGFLLASVYWDNPTQTLKAFKDDIRYSAASISNPVTDLRSYGTTGFDMIQSTLFETDRKENLIPFGNFEVTDNNLIKGWLLGEAGTILPASGSRCLKVSNGTDNSLIFPIDCSLDYSFKIKAHTDGVIATYQVNLLFYRGKNKTRDKVGSKNLITGTPTYSLWTTIEKEFLSSDTITWDGSLQDRNAIGWAVLEISVSSGAVYLDEVVIKPKTRSIDIEAGTLRYNALYVAGTYTATYKDTLILVDGTGGGFTLTLPTAIGYTGKFYKIKLIGNNTVAIQTTGGETIDGATTLQLTKFHQTVELTSQDTGWRITGGFFRQPVISDYTNAQHNHTDAANGGLITASSVSSILGTWQTASFNVNYYASTDLVVHASSNTAGYNGAVAYITGYTDNVSVPVTVRAKESGTAQNGSESMGFSMMVRKGDYWRVDLAGDPTAYLLFFISLGV